MDSQRMRLVTTHWRLTLIFFCVAAWVSPPVFAQATVAPDTHDTVDYTSAIRTVLEAFHERAEFPGATLAGVIADGTVVTVSVGNAFTETSTPMTADHRLMAGSTGKTFFAALALQLADEGVLDLDALISTWLAEEPWFDRLPNASTITLRMLLNHTSGIPRHIMVPAFIDAITEQPDRTWAPAELIAFILDAEPAFDAGDGWSYADTNFVIAGLIIEKVTGESCYNQIYRRILRPYSLWDVVPTTSRDVLGLSGGYVDVRSNLLRLREPNVVQHGRFVVNPQFEWAGGGFASTPRDLARWADVLYSGNVLSDAMQTEMRTSVVAQLGPGSRYGLGMIQRPSALGDVIGHSGYFPGYLTDMSYYVDHDLALALQVNTTRMSPAMNPSTMRRALDDVAAALLNE